MDQTFACKHKHTQVIAKDDESEYIECLDCGVIFERQELAETPETEPPNSEESLSDA